VDGGVRWRGVLSRNWHSGGRLGLSPFIGLCSKARWREAASVECIFMDVNALDSRRGDDGPGCHFRERRGDGVG
jgi:hypothetical protein